MQLSVFRDNQWKYAAGFSIEAVRLSEDTVCRRREALERNTMYLLGSDLKHSVVPPEEISREEKKTMYV